MPVLQILSFAPIIKYSLKILLLTWANVDGDVNAVAANVNDENGDEFDDDNEEDEGGLLLLACSAIGLALAKRRHANAKPKNQNQQVSGISR